MTQKHHRLVFILFASLAVALTGCASGGNQTGSQQGSNSSGVGASDVASLLNGSYKLQDQDGGSDLRLNISSTQGVGSRFTLLATASGTYQGHGVNEQGVLELETEGPDVRMAVIPHFGEPVTVLSPDVTQFSPAERQAACQLHLRSDENGWMGTTLGQGDCVRAIGGAIGQWQVEILPGTIRFVDAKTKQALVFQKTGDRAGR
jgi:hypothetical protein